LNTLLKRWIFTVVNFEECQSKLLENIALCEKDKMMV